MVNADAGEGESEENEGEEKKEMQEDTQASKKLANQDGGGKAPAKNRPAKDKANA